MSNEKLAGANSLRKKLPGAKPERSTQMLSLGASQCRGKKKEERGAKKNKTLARLRISLRKKDSRKR